MCLDRNESIFRGTRDPALDGQPGVSLRTFASSACGATNFYTGTATFEPGAELPFHTHRVSEALVILEGEAMALMGNRVYQLEALDCLHIPAFLPHCLRNDDSSSLMIAHCTFAEAQPVRTFTAQSVAGPMEHLRRFQSSEKYELSEGALFCDLFAKRFGARGICGGYGRFRPGSSLPCHMHRYDESITIVTGEAACLVQGQQYQLSGYDTAFIPEGRPHRFLNRSDKTMAMIWVYAGDEPDRTLVEAGYCSGEIAWKG